MDGLAQTGNPSPEYQNKMLTARAAIDLQLGRVDQAANDASRATRLAQQAAVPGNSSVDVGHAFLVLGRALQAQGSSQAQAAFRSAAQNLAATLGDNHPQTLEARKLTDISR